MVASAQLMRLTCDMQTVTLYTGRSAPFARVAAYWLHKLASYTYWPGRGAAILRRTCEANHMRNVEIAAREARNASLMARAEGVR